MSIRILHTADNHIGLSFRQYPEIQPKLVQERFSALERIVAHGNQKKAHFLVIAGDLFDKPGVSFADIRKTVSILKQFSGQAVLVLAGNHDFYDGPENKLWKEFAAAARDCDSIHLLLKPEVHSFECEGKQINFYACPCPSKLSAEPVNGWVSSTEKASGEWHIGIAHGNVEGIGPDGDQRYFNMKPQDLNNAGLHTWLLGHIHVPYPAPGLVGTPAFFMPGIHTPDSVKVRHEGHAWYMELEPGKDIRYESFQPGSIRFERLKAELNDEAGLESFKLETEKLTSSGLILDLEFSGRLHADLRQQLADWLQEKSNSFLHLSFDLRDIKEMHDLNQLNKHWPEGSLPHELLRQLLETDPKGDDAQLAMQILESI